MITMTGNARKQRLISYLKRQSEAIFCNKKNQLQKIGIILITIYLLLNTYLYLIIIWNIIVRRKLIESRLSYHVKLHD